jgi:hypothetical protein
MISINKTTHQAAKDIGCNEIDETDKSHGLFVHHFNGKDMLYGIIIPEYSIEAHGTIAHECKHFVNRLFDTKGIKLDIENDEAECYLLKWAVDEVYKAIKKHKIS